MNVAILKNKNYLSKKVCEFTFIPKLPLEINFVAGQFINILAQEDTFRAYSLASDPSVKNSFKLIVDISHEGVGSNYLKNLKMGEEIKFAGPSGRFKLHHHEYPIYFFATSTGIAPIIAMLYQLLRENYTNKIRLFFGVRKNNEIFYLDIFNNFKTIFTDFDFTIYISADNEITQYQQGRITNGIDTPFENNAQFYLCGNPNMVKDATNKLVEKGLDDIYTEGFSS